MRYALVITDLHGERRIPLVGTLTVGRDPSCEIYDPDALLSRRHAQFALTSRGASVKDLDSRNGIQVNGVSVKDAMLRQGDVVQIAHLRIRYEETIDEPVAAAPAADDATRALDVNVEALADAPEVSGDATRVVLPGMVAPQMRAAAPAVAAAPVAAAPSAPAVAGPAAAPARVAPAPSRAAASAGEPAAADTRAVAALSPDAAATSHAARGPWMVTVQIHAIALAIIAFLVAAMPALMWHDAQLTGFAEERASTLINWGAAEGRIRFESGRPTTDALDTILKQPGVVGALLVGLDGRILAPASRAQDHLTRLDGLNVSPADVYRMQIAHADDLTVAAIPVGTASNPRVAIAWLSVRASDLGAQFESSGAVLAPMFLIAIMASVAMGFLLYRGTTRRLSALNEDTEMAMAGQLRTIGDTLGTRATRDLSATLNYLMARVRAVPGADAAAATGASVPAAPRAGTAPAAPASRFPAAAPAPEKRGRESFLNDSRHQEHQEQPAAPAARPATASSTRPMAAPPPPPAPAPTPALPPAKLVADAQLRVTEASDSCGTVFGVPKDRALGQHVLDAISVRSVLDAVLKCLSALPGAGQHEVQAVHDPTGKALRIRVSRAGRDQPVSIEAQEES